MAVDTRDKRASAIWPLLPFRALLPTPDASVDQANRQQIVFLYGGILAGAPSVPTAIRTLTLRDRSADLNIRTRTPDINIRLIS